MRRFGVPLSALTTMKVGGPARVLADVGSVSEIVEVLEFAKSEQLSVSIMGGGSNTLASDIGFPGIILRSSDARVEFDESSSAVRACAGVPWDAFVAMCVARGYFGLENLSGIPGTVGASPIQNIGAYGKEVGEMITRVEAFDLRQRKIVTLDGEECEFAYRDSVFKRRSELFILSVTFQLFREASPDIHYRDLAEWFSGRSIKKPTPIEVRDAVLAIRARKFPDLRTHGTAGSFFKNPIVPKVVADKLALRFPQMPRYPTQGDSFKLSAAWLIDKVAGLRGARDGNVGSWEGQALVLVNYGGATSADVDAFADRVARAVKDVSGITLEREVTAIHAIDLS